MEAPAVAAPGVVTVLGEVDNTGRSVERTGVVDFAQNSHVVPCQQAFHPFPVQGFAPGQNDAEGSGRRLHGHIGTSGATNG